MEEPKEEFKYVWLDINTGKFSNSWGENTHNNVGEFLTEEELKNSAEKNWMLIKYKCVNKPEFELYNMMKLR